jgi:hypothetical protein
MTTLKYDWQLHNWTVALWKYAYSKESFGGKRPSHSKSGIGWIPSDRVTLLS